MKIRAGLIGSDIGRSRFGQAMQLLCTARDIELEYTAIDTSGDTTFDLDRTVAALRAEGWTGVSVTHPHKIHAARIARQAGSPGELSSANLLLFGAGITATNTDYLGFLQAWRTTFGARRPGSVALAGAGGVAHAIGPALARLGAASIAIWDVDADQSRTLARDIGPVATALTPERVADAIAAADGLVNATPLGMGSSRRSAFDPALLGPQTWAFDAVYTPADTPFLQDARRAGLTTISGFELFRHMAVASFAAYCDQAADPADLLKLIETLRPTEMA